MVMVQPFSAQAILDHLQRHGAQMWVQGAALRISAPAAVLTPALRALIVEQKPALVKLMTPVPPMTPEVAERVQALDKVLTAWLQAGSPMPVPRLVLPGAPTPPEPGRCVSCGAPVPPIARRERCATCTQALGIVLLMEEERMQGL